MNVPTHSRAASRRGRTEVGGAGLERVLVIDDDEDLVAVLCEVLRDSGLHPVPASSFERARRAMRAGDLDAVVLDWLLGDTPTEPLLVELAALPEPVPTLVFSATESAAHVAARFGVPFLAKPFDLESFLTLVSQVRRERRTPRPPA